MATDAPAIPRVEETGLDRDDLTSAAEELGIDDIDSLDDQALFEQIGLRLGEISEDQLSEATEETQEAAEEVQDSAEGAVDEAEDTAEDAQDTAEDAAGEAEDEAEDTAEKAQDTAEDEQVTEDRKQARDRGEYRVEDDDRPGVEPVLDLELGPVAIDILGLEVHLNRLHAAVTANPGHDLALLGKLLAKVGQGANAIGLGKATDQVTGVVDKALDALPSPDMGADEDGDEQGDDEGDEQGDDEDGVLSTLAKPFTALGRIVKNVASNAKDVAGDAKDAGTSGAGAAKNAASGNTLRAMKDGKDALGHAKDAAAGTATLATSED